MKKQQAKTTDCELAEGQLVRVIPHVRFKSEDLQYGLVLEIVPTRYAGAKFKKQRIGVLVLWSNGKRAWEPYTYLEPVGDA